MAKPKTRDDFDFSFKKEIAFGKPKNCSPLP